MTTSRIFELQHFATGALSRHGATIENATAEQRKRARALGLEHLENLFLAALFEDERNAENRRKQAEHEQAKRAAAIAARVNAWASAKVSSLEGLASFFCDTLGATITSCDEAGAVGTKAAHRQAGEAASDLRNQRSEKLFAVSLPPGVIAIRGTSEAFEHLRASRSLPVSCGWFIGGHEYALYSGNLARDIEAGPVAFLKTVRCGTAASWLVSPAETNLEHDASLPPLPPDIQGAVENTAPGAEKLLASFLF